MQPFDIVQGAQSPASRRVFVIGAFDSRITFYSQQVRALELIYALRHQAILQDTHRVAVVGAGAAGLSAAASIALLSTARVDLFERSDEVLPLQRASQLRHLDPHIYAWPAIGSDDPAAELPILDWTAGPAATVRQDVKLEFENVVALFPQRIRVNLRHEVTDSGLAGGKPQLTFRRDPHAGEAGNGPDLRVSAQATFDLVILAFGFGLEPAHTPAGVTVSYWSDASVPVSEFQGRAAPRFLISGNGDGGLIDLVAAASADFDHAGMIQQIANQAGMDAIFERLETIDKQAQAAFDAGNGFDFTAAYDASIRDDLDQLGLFELVTNRLRPGVRLTLQTLGPEAFTIQTARLNRLAAYLVLRACETKAQTEFTHVHGNDLAPTAAPVPQPYPAPLWFQCGGTTFGVDAAIIRHGPDRSGARLPFTELLGDYATTHNAWLKLHGEAVRIPAISPAAREALVIAAQQAGLPLPLYQQRQLQLQRPRRIRVQPDGSGLRWSGDLASAAIGDLWAPPTPPVNIYVPSPPDQLGGVAGAIVRFALHSGRATLIAGPGDWRAFIDPLTTGSAHAEHLPPPAIEAGAPAGATQNVEQSGSDNLSLVLHGALNAWVLNAANQTLGDFIGTGRDPGQTIGFPAAPDLRVRMGEIWAGWHAQLAATPELLDRFLRLMVCAEDRDEGLDEARVLIGPRKLPSIIRGIAAALAVASAWPDTLPHDARPGNLSRMPGGGQQKCGHVCGAERIAREPTAIAAATFMWRTHFVILSQLTTPITIAEQAEVGIGEIGQAQPGLDETTGAGGLFLTLDAAFRAAAGTGLADLTALLNAAETDYFQRLAAAAA
ncbi:ABC-three component system protein [Croceicoccus marinus]|uniref:ABC-three component systems C-terminal domain-containing protein n=1 Tax=Croceicoccus marinus TaxID=450378 RepID=A0A7G6VTL5_9SPHN|nr:ABC-three component system protein [Croceicoccus marinus]QNE05080.1 hypothetical protein H4O24_14480 [Croceicoccus marinus]